VPLSSLTAGANLSVNVRTCSAILRGGSSPIGTATLIVVRR
jgi:hypothetical protein